MYKIYVKGQLVYSTESFLNWANTDFILRNSSWKADVLSKNK